MPYTYDAELTKQSVHRLYILPPLLLGGAVYSAWLATEARRTHTEISLGAGSMNMQWWEGYALSITFVVVAILAVWVARVSAKRLREQEQRQRE